jgi:hypothetical protein
MEETNLHNNLHKKYIPKFFCSKCDFKCCLKSDWDRHISTRKHLGNQNGNKGKNVPLTTYKFTYFCDCGKGFETNSGLWKHSKKCNIDTEDKVQETALQCISEKDLIMLLINDNKELRNVMIEQLKESNEMKSMMMEVIKNGTTHNTTNTNCNNKSFNLQVFLNETCKDAMNIMDFVDSIKLQLSDLEKVGEVGYVEGITNIILNNLKALDITKRPFHCTDKKREILYIKDDNKWEKEDENKAKMRKFIKYVAHKNIMLIPDFKEKYPDCGFSHSRKSDQYNKLIIESMGGSGNNDAENEDKIIRNIAKVITIDKNKDGNIE